MVDMRVGGSVAGGTFVWHGAALRTAWHSHDLHEIEYAMGGVVEVETADGHYLLPPQQAAWIPAGMSHRTTIRAEVRTISVLIEPSLVPDPGDRAAILAVAPVLREMVLYGTRWPIHRTASDDFADSFFQALGHLVTGALADDALPLHLPTSAHPVVAAAMAYASANLGEASLRGAAAAARVSERTLRRLFAEQVGMSWRRYLVQARLMRAMAMLSVGRASILDVATGVGFESVSAFSRAFFRHTGETPSAYRRRVGVRGR